MTRFKRMLMLYVKSMPHARFQQLEGVWFATPLHGLHADQLPMAWDSIKSNATSNSRLNLSLSR